MGIFADGLTCRKFVQQEKTSEHFLFDCEQNDTIKIHSVWFDVNESDIL